MLHGGERYEFYMLVGRANMYHKSERSTRVRYGNIEFISSVEPTYNALFYLLYYNLMETKYQIQLLISECFPHD